MSKKINRRDFIKVSSLGLGAAAVGASLFEPFDLFGENRSFKGPVIEKVPIYCEICFWKCAGWGIKKDGAPWKIEGNENDPLCNGRLCPRGSGGMGAYMDNERLKVPLIRTEAREKQTFREATWDEAFEYIAEKLEKIKKEHGPECVALFTHGSGGTFFKTVLNGWGSQNVAAPSYAQCRGPREDAYAITYGELLGSPANIDIKNTDCLVLIGSHLGENMHNSQVQEFSELLERGATIITVDPRFSVAASKSKYWLPIKPATDIALLLAWINVIIEEELYDKEFVEKYTFGFDALKTSTKNNTPEWAYPITTIKPDVIRKTAREMAKASPRILVHPGRHVTWYGDDTQRVRAEAIINALLGSWGRKGGFYFPAKMSVPKYPIPKFPKPKRTWRDVNPGKYPLASLALASGLCDATIPSIERDCNIKGWIVYGTNIPLTIPNFPKTLEAIQALDLMVAVDIMPTEVTGWADVILPECTYLERYDDLRVSPSRVPTVALRAPVFKPMYNSKPAWWMAKELAKKLKLEKYFPWQNIEEYLDYRLKKIDSSLEEMKRIGVKQFDWDEPLYGYDGEENEFFTPTGKIELYSTQLEEHGFDPIPKYTRHEEPPEGYYRLTYGRAPMHTFSRTTNNPILTQIKSENEVWISTTVAKEWGIENGQYLQLVNQDGVVSNKVKAKVTQRIRNDCVFMVHGFGHRQKQMARSYLKGADDNQLITRVKVDPIMGGTGMRVNFVTFKLEDV
ncbi:molybdopterin-dependent oxidoreductase [candidate division KSB1 bacterium]|nr:molybdopterin-dependent oxidoreductase [candidate division KSB1 bacterium]